MFSYRDPARKILYTGNPMNMKSSVANGDAVTLKRENTNLNSEKLALIYMRFYSWVNDKIY